MSVRTAPPTVDPSAAAADPRAVAFARLLAVVDRLRAPDGCPWDKKQTLATMAPHLVEEAHEAVEAIELGRTAQTVEECGDVLMVVTLLCRIAEQDGQFDLSAAAHGIADKLIRRHPHVFGEVVADTAEQVVTNWEAIKKAEREEKREDSSAIAGVPVALPALQRAYRVGGKAVSAGFRWADPSGALEKLREEQAEFEQALEGVDVSRDGMPGVSSEQRARVEHELGDVILAAAFAGRYLGIDPERVAREAVRRFESRFRAMEIALDVSAARPLGDATLEAMMSAWQSAKSAEKDAAP